MKREYADGVKEDVTYFTGYEVEKTPAYEMHTLFVTGCQSLEDVLAKAKEHTVEHIYLGANHSFVPKDSWEDLVQGLLNKKFLVTLDYDVKYHEWILESGFNENPDHATIMEVAHRALGARVSLNSFRQQYVVACGAGESAKLVVGYRH